jgi:hypothetical protein
MTTLVSLEVTRRQKELAELKQIQKYEMGFNQIKRKEDNYNKSTSASKDKYMVEALKKVKQSNITFNNDYTDMTGSGLYNPRTKPNTLDDLDKQMSDELKSFKKELKVSSNGYVKKPLQTNKPKIQKEEKELNWNMICEQLGKERWTGNQLTLFRQIKEALTVKGKQI